MMHDDAGGKTAYFPLRGQCKDNVVIVVEMDFTEDNSKIKKIYKQFNSF
jgi:uncharacterized radical SAM superfamily protein